LFRASFEKVDSHSDGTFGLTCFRGADSSKIPAARQGESLLASSA